MKKLILPLIMAFIATAAGAQIRHVPGIKSVDIYYGVSGHGTVVGASFIKYWKSNLYMKAGGFQESGTDNGISYQSIGGDFKVARTLLKKSPWFYFNGVAGATFSIDQPREGGQIFNLQSKPKYGALAGVEMEFFISDRFVFFSAWDQRFLLGSEYGNYRWFGTGGIRFNF